jgi:hypothetical protein
MAHACRCTFCGQEVPNRCIHQSQVKWCNQRPVNLYGRYETHVDGVLVEKGTGPIDTAGAWHEADDLVIFTNGATVTRVAVSSLSTY